MDTLFLNYKLSKIMKKTVLALGIVCICLGIKQQVTAQSGNTITVEEGGTGACSNATIHTFTYTGHDGGSPARNIYSVAVWEGNGGLAEIKWVVNRWELINYDGPDAFTLWFSTANTSPNPPDLATGGWAADEFNGCDPLTRLDGTGTQSASLPVDLVNFDAKSKTNAVELEWQTASEQNNQGFYIERNSSANNRWEELGFKAGHGTSNEQQRYSFVDEHPMPGTNYYRLRQVDFDGRIDFSPIEVTEVKVSDTSLKFFPNPTQQGHTTLYVPTASSSDAVLEILDCMGHKVLRQSLHLEGSGTDQFVPIDMSSYPFGVYTARLEIGGSVISERLVVAN
ncbi:MAG: T9SS type A sorting domain-containing protein [Saprospiraceae bacterium]|nr:T9SS type A sorting domain-containing protein [Saprospiraceae bacterium]